MRRYEDALFGIYTQALGPVYYGDFIAKCLEALVAREEFAYARRHIKLDRQLKTRVVARSFPDQILKISGPFSNRSIEAVAHQVTEERNDVEEGTLAAGIWPNEHMKPVETDVDVAEAAKTKSLYTANHRRATKKFIKGEE